MGYLVEGQKVEDAFARTIGGARSATKEQDMYGHFDLIIETKVDVKKMKKIRRSDPEPNEDYHYVEIYNVHGKKGWLYGDADAFAFETHSYFVLVNKGPLQDLVQNKTIKECTQTPQLYHLYRRSGRKDLMTLVKTIDLCAIASQIIHKGDL